MPGAFIVFEGGEGAGKSTALEALAARLREEGHEVVTCREPGGSPAGEAVRDLLQLDLSPWAEAFAFLVARAELVTRVIRPALTRGDIVLCDRFDGSTYAYQGFGRGLSLDGLRAANSLVTGGLAPGLVLWLDLDPADGLRRKHGETGRIRTGDEDLEFHERVREGYRRLAAGDRRWRRIDAAASAETVAARAYALTQEYLYRTPRPV